MEFLKSDIDPAVKKYIEKADSRKQQMIEKERKETADKRRMECRNFLLQFLNALLVGIVVLAIEHFPGIIRFLARFIPHV